MPDNYWPISRMITMTLQTKLSIYPQLWLNYKRFLNGDKPGFDLSAKPSKADIKAFVQLL